MIYLEHFLLKKAQKIVYIEIQNISQNMFNFQICFIRITVSILLNAEFLQLL